MGRTERTPSSWRRGLGGILGYGLAGGLLLVLLEVTEYRFLVLGHALEIYTGLVAALFAGVGIWLGWTLRRRRPEAAAHGPPGTGARSSPRGERPEGDTPFVRNEQRVDELGLTPRELEILDLIAAGLSNRQIAGRLFVTENTVKTHTRNLFAKLGARRRTQAVRLGRETRLIP